MANPINLGTIVDQSTGISTAWGQGINDWVYGAYGVLGATFSAGAFRAALGASAPADIQAQTATAFTTAGTSTAYTLTPTPAITSMVAGQRFRVKFNATAGAAPTLAISGLAATALKLYDSTGAKVAASSTSIIANMLTDVEYDGTDMVILDPLPSSGGSAIQPVTSTQSGGALTIGLNPTTLDFRSTTLTTGVPVTRSVGAAISLVAPSGGTLGFPTTISGDIIIVAIDNAGTVELAVVNLAGGNDLSETGVINTTAINTASDSANVFYSTTARTGVAYRIIGKVTAVNTAGAWGNPTLVQGYGGQALAAMSSLGYGQTWQSVTRTSGTTYYNTKDKPITVVVNAALTSTSGAVLTVNGATTGQVGTSVNMSPSLNMIVPPGNSYMITITGSGGSITSIFELR